MFAASSRLRIAAALVASALATLCAAAGSAQSIDLSLNVLYTNPSNLALGGAWQLVAKSSASPTTFGISGIAAKLAGINNDVTIQGPRAIVNGSTVAGFQILSDITHGAVAPNPAYHEVVVAQLPLFPLPSGSEENLFYGVGNIANGAPNYPGKPAGSVSIGPAFTSLTNPQGIAWASTPDPLGDAAWNIAASLLSGTFTGATAPAFVSGSTGNIFTSVPVSNNALGNEALASAITTVVRTNAVAMSADYNQNGIVDAPDYVLWKKTNLSPAVPPGSGADGNRDGTVNLADYTLWQSRFGNPFGAGSGGGLSTGAIPEPTGCILLTIGALLFFTGRQGRFQHPVNN